MPKNFVEENPLLCVAATVFLTGGALYGYQQFKQSVAAEMHDHADTISVKLSKLKSSDIVSELSKMIDHASLSVSNGGQIFVSITGYKGAITLNEFITTFFMANAFDWPPRASLEQRLACDDLWDKIHNLCTTAVNKVRSYNMFFQAVISLRVLYLASNDPIAVILNPDCHIHKSLIFAFEPREFAQLFPNSQNFGTLGRATSIMGGPINPDSELWLATREMLDNKIKDRLADGLRRRGCQMVS